MGMPIPEEYGGAGGDTVSYALAIEELTRIDSSVAITVAAHTSLGTMPILLFGNEEQKREWLPELASGQRLAAFGLTEPGAGSDAGRDADDRRAARRRSGSSTARRSSSRTPARTSPACVTITARTGDGRDLEHHRPERHARLRDLGADEEARLAGLGHARALVPGLRGAGGNLLGPRGRGLPPVPRDPRRRADLGRRDGRRARAGRLRPRLSRTRRSGEQFGRPISTFQAVQFRLADMATEIEAGARARLQGRVAEGSGPAVRARGGDGEALHRASSRTAPSTGRCRSTAATATWTSTRSRGSTATRRSSRSARARTRCSAW